MKKSKLLTPILTIGTLGVVVTPMTVLTSCNKTGSISIDQKTIKSGDSYTSYKFKLPTVPSDKKVSVEITNKTATQEQVILDPDLVLTNGSNYSTELAVDDEGNVEVPVCYAYAPTTSSTSVFGVTFKYGSTTETVDDLTFDYAVDYDVDLKDGGYDPETQSKVKAQDATYWSGKDVAATYMTDMLAKPIIFQSDARYSTSLAIKKALDSGDFTNLKSFRAYFNNVYEDDKGLNVQMNYEVKGQDTGSQFQFIQEGQGEQGQGQRRFTFKNFDLTCNFMTENGYTFTWDGTNKQFILKDPTTKYDLAGRMVGKFDIVVESRESSSEEFTQTYSKTGINYDGLITLDETNEEKYSDQFLAFMFAFGVIHLTYGFGWGVQPAEIQLKIDSYYAKNA